MPALATMSLLGRLPVCHAFQAERVLGRSMIHKLMIHWGLKIERSRRALIAVNCRLLPRKLISDNLASSLSMLRPFTRHNFQEIWVKASAISSEDDTAHWAPVRTSPIVFGSATAFFSIEQSYVALFTLSKNSVCPLKNCRLLAIHRLFPRAKASPIPRRD